MSDWISMDDDDDGEVYPVRRIFAFDLVYTGLGFLGGVLDAASDAVGDLQHLVGGHLNHKRDREEFAESAGLEIEMMTAPMPVEEDES